MPSAITASDTGGWDQAGRALDVINSTSTALTRTGVVGGIVAILTCSGLLFQFDAVGAYNAAFAQCERTITFIKVCRELPGMSLYFNELVTELEKATVTERNELLRADLQASTSFPQCLGKLPIRACPWIKSAKALRTVANEASQRLYTYQMDLQSSTEIAKLLLATNAPPMTAEQQNARLNVVRSERRTLQERMKQVVLCFSCLRRRARMEQGSTDIESIIPMANLNLSNQNGGGGEAVPSQAQNPEEVAIPNSAAAASDSSELDIPSSPEAEGSQSDGTSDAVEGPPSSGDIIAVRLIPGELTLDEVLQAIAAVGVDPSEPSEYSTTAAEPT